MTDLNRIKWFVDTIDAIFNPASVTEASSKMFLSVLMGIFKFVVWLYLGLFLFIMWYNMVRFLKVFLEGNLTHKLIFDTMKIFLQLIAVLWLIMPVNYSLPFSVDMDGRYPTSWYLLKVSYELGTNWAGKMVESYVEKGIQNPEPPGILTDIARQAKAIGTDMGLLDPVKDTEGQFRDSFNKIASNSGASMIAAEIQMRPSIAFFYLPITFGITAMAEQDLAFKMGRHLEQKSDEHAQKYVQQTGSKGWLNSLFSSVAGGVAVVAKGLRSALLSAKNLALSMGKGGGVGLIFGLIADYIKPFIADSAFASGLIISFYIGILSYIALMLLYALIMPLRIFMGFWGDYGIQSLFEIGRAFLAITVIPFVFIGTWFLAMFCRYLYVNMLQPLILSFISYDSSIMGWLMSWFLPFIVIIPLAAMIVATPSMVMRIFGVQFSAPVEFLRANLPFARG